MLGPCAIFSKVMQADEIALTSLLCTQKEIEKLQSLSFSQWPVYSSTLKKLQAIMLLSGPRTEKV